MPLLVWCPFPLPSPSLPLPSSYLHHPPQAATSLLPQFAAPHGFPILSSIGPPRVPIEPILNLLQLAQGVFDDESRMADKAEKENFWLLKKQEVMQVHLTSPLENHGAEEKHVIMVYNIHYVGFHPFISGVQLCLCFEWSFIISVFSL